jgi:hypothetical protein
MHSPAAVVLGAVSERVLDPREHEAQGRREGTVHVHAALHRALRRHRHVLGPHLTAREEGDGVRGDEGGAGEGGDWVM